MSKAMGSRYSVESSRESREYFEFVKDLLDHEVVGEMKKFRHHYSTTCYQHCLNVSYYNYLVCKKLGLNAKAAARAGMLHDLFLYDWRDEPRKRGELPHGFSHPRIALENAKEHFELDKLEEDMIVKHMWPLTVKLPRYAESYVIVMIDKYAAMLEFGVHCKNKLSHTVRSIHKHNKSS
ncbi:HD domain-containing protein [Ruminococcus sp.]|uniref:HD domain-containing protein n=1 Tax=Ruminococcus sp. TaxID=41978 RepID=UPI0025F5F243|nr:HD domain-containing protein [Ruminococcus sp.]MBQ8967954.1 HD family phosphohydrolase [Ruminococcus sp.]